MNIENLDEYLSEHPEWVNIGGLPSNFFPYTFKELWAKPFNIAQLKLIGRSIQQKDLDLQLQAINSCISQDVYSLTPGDYAYIREWIRVQSSPNSPKVVTWECNEVTYRKGDEFLLNDPESLASRPDLSEYTKSICGTNNSQVLYVTNLDIVQVPDTYSDALPEGFDWPRMRNYVEMVEARQDPELRFLIKSVQWVKGETLKDKIASLEEEQTLDKFNLGLLLNDTLEHGIEEKALFRCRTCQSQFHSKLETDDISFFL